MMGTTAILQPTTDHKEPQMKTIVAYTLHNEDHTATLLRKAGLFWFVQDAEGVEHRIPAKAVDETWEEEDDYLDEPATEAEHEALAEQALIEDLEPAPEPEPAAAPSLAEQALAGPTTEAPKSMITLAEICDTYGVVGRIARRQLRNAVKAGTLTHDAGADWVFVNTPESIDAVMKIITTKKRG